MRSPITTDPWHKNFFGQRDALLHAIRRQDGFLRQYGAIDSLLCQYEYTWNAPEPQPLRTIILAGCDAFRYWFSQQSASQFLALLVEASNVADNPDLMIHIGHPTVFSLASAFQAPPSGRRLSALQVLPEDLEVGPPRFDGAAREKGGVPLGIVGGD